jgi:hypothetical protein
MPCLQGHRISGGGAANTGLVGKSILHPAANVWVRDGWRPRKRTSAEHGIHAARAFARILFRMICTDINGGAQFCTPDFDS